MMNEMWIILNQFYSQSYCSCTIGKKENDLKDEHMKSTEIEKREVSFNQKRVTKTESLAPMHHPNDNQVIKEIRDWDGNEENRGEKKSGAKI